MVKIHTSTLNFPIYTSFVTHSKLNVVFVKILAFCINKIPNACKYGKKTLFAGIHLIVALSIILFKP